jgi:hypothetical protein
MCSLTQLLQAASTEVEEMRLQLLQHEEVAVAAAEEQHKLRQQLCDVGARCETAEAQVSCRRLNCLRL